MSKPETIQKAILGSMTNPEYSMCLECEGLGRIATHKQTEVDVFITLPFERWDKCTLCDGEGFVEDKK